MRWLGPVLLLFQGICLPPFEAGEGDPATRWLGVYAWIQTGDRLAAAEQWPLALGSYLEANRQLGELAAAHPGFEREMVSYRRNRLSAILTESESRLTDDEHEVMMKYLDFIESLELGESQRYRDEFEEAYATLNLARAILEEIVASKPDGFREAVASQVSRLESGISWLDSQINFEAMNRPVAPVAGDPVDWGTTRFVRESDLPRAGGGGSTSAALFPGGPALSETSPDSSPEPAEGKGGAGSPRFRMSSRQKSAPELPEADSPGGSALPVP